MHLKSQIKKQKADERRDTKGKCFLCKPPLFSGAGCTKKYRSPQQPEQMLVKVSWLNAQIYF